VRIISSRRWMLLFVSWRRPKNDLETVSRMSIGSWRKADSSQSQSIRSEIIDASRT
jgi:hypothetical protein